MQSVLFLPFPPWDCPVESFHLESADFLYAPFDSAFVAECYVRALPRFMLIELCGVAGAQLSNRQGRG
jgi:hypothetical protein